MLPRIAIRGLLLAVLSIPAIAQQRKESLRVLLQLAPSAQPNITAVTVRIVNLTPRTVNLLVPRGLACQQKPGTLSLDWKYKGDANNAARAVESIDTLCPPQPPSLGGGPGLQADAMQHGTWMHFAPGQYVDIHDTITTVSLVEGRYEVRAVYTAPKFNSDERSQIRYQGIEMPKGEYKSDSISFLMEATQ